MTSYPDYTQLPPPTSTAVQPPPPVEQRSRSKALVITLIALVLVLIAAAAVAVAYAMEANRKQETITSLTNSLAEATAKIDRAEADLAASRASVETASDRASALQEEVDKLQTCAVGLVSTLSSALDDDYVTALSELSEVKTECEDVLGSGATF